MSGAASMQRHATTGTPAGAPPPFDLLDLGYKAPEKLSATIGRDKPSDNNLDIDPELLGPDKPDAPQLLQSNSSRRWLAPRDTPRLSLTQKANSVISPSSASSTKLMRLRARPAVARAEYRMT